MQAFKNDAAIKAHYLQRVAEHRVADQIRTGNYWSKGDDGTWRGCAVGCTIHGNEHSAYERELGIPMVLAYLEDSIFERLGTTATERAQKWPEEFLEAVPVGADLSDVSRQFLLWCLQKQVLPMAQPSPDCVAAVERVIALYEMPREEDVAAEAAEAEAEAREREEWAGAEAARAAWGAEAGARAAARAAAECAAWAPEWAAWAPGECAAEWAAAGNGTVQQADQLLELLRATSPGGA